MKNNFEKERMIITEIIAKVVDAISEKNYSEIFNFCRMILCQPSELGEIIENQLNNFNIDTIDKFNTPCNSRKFKEIGGFIPEWNQLKICLSEYGDDEAGGDAQYELSSDGKLMGFLITFTIIIKCEEICVVWDGKFNRVIENYFI